MTSTPPKESLSQIQARILGRIDAAESQVATLTALVAELQRRVAALEEQRLVPVRRYDGELVSVRVPDFSPPMLQESAPSGPRAEGPHSRQNTRMDSEKVWYV